MNQHEYALVGGLNRAKVGRYVGTIAAFVSSFLVLILVSTFEMAKKYGLSESLPPAIFALVSASAVYTVLYWIFSVYIWRFRLLRSLLRVPDLNGQWHCEGRRLNIDGEVEEEWVGTITILQNWDKIRVALKTSKSQSDSITASLIWDKVSGYRLLYNYKNDPNNRNLHLQPHIGFVDLVFNGNCMSAEGQYFNGYRRFTFGTMVLRRKSNGL